MPTVKKRKLLIFWNMITKVPTTVVLTTTHDQHKEIGKFSTFNLSNSKLIFFGKKVNHVCNANWLFTPQLVALGIKIKVGPNFCLRVDNCILAVVLFRACAYN